MIQVRQGVFEANSSSTHSITMCTKNEFNEWVDGKIQSILKLTQLIIRRPMEKKSQLFVIMDTMVKEN